MIPFFQRSRGDSWHRIGLASAFPDLSLQENCSKIHPSCKAFHIPKVDTGSSSGDSPQEADIEAPGDLKDQVLVFQYKGKFHAVDHSCPHSAFPLSQASVFDIEDFGITLSAGLTCPKHGWSFDLFSGQGDRGNYKLKIWEIDLREPSMLSEDISKDEKEVWVRRKQRIG
ncbi:Rieske domain-containing protein [Penicillium ucsense]|uniref:Rieske domain-containing protein n=1 Tax=Penicillium ucsense TaxID=2839758 RepID=A0A8J8W553_9EURO|nr:Rieske domain-containing protein [Penicillium ucsense]KAF7732174.1 Rieske domain-containing protein [Penicillium ucsense]